MTPAPGARPAGVTDPTTAADNIRAMFDTIAPTYDRANHLLSAGIDRYWWNRAASTLQHILGRPEAIVLDLCCGTGDMTLALDKYRPQQFAISPAPILAADFSHNMLALALPKFASRNILPLEADALRLPLASASIDLVTAAFGFRNLTDYAAGLAEIYRILRPAGEMAILDFNQPTGLLGLAYDAYFNHILPHVGGLISRDPAAYAYLPASVARFPRPASMLQLMAAAGFTQATWTSYTFGIAGLYRAAKPPTPVPSPS